jgi:ABC-type antimicrobial peptide transport system permease subunit
MINWQQFGLRSNPYDIVPLIEGGELPIKQAFVGRKEELKTLEDIILSENRACITILGNVGVGKTSLANFHKFIFKHDQTAKPLFSFRREIEASENLINKRSFILEIIGSVLKEIKLLHPDLIEQDPLLKKLRKLVDITQALGISGGINVGIVNANFSESSIDIPVIIPISILEGYFIDLIDFIRKNKIAGKTYEGLIVHVNNFDVLLKDPSQKKKVLTFFQEIRDFLQTRHVYFIFLGPKTFYRDIIAKENRIKGIFHLSPIMVGPLSKEEVLQALEERMELLKSPDVVRYITPVSQEVIFRLYDFYDGDVRSIMNAIKAILSQASDTIVEPLGLSEALLLLGKERWNDVEKLDITKGQTQILIALAKAHEYITQKDISKQFRKAQTNISSHYFSPLSQAGIIEVKREEGKMKYWGLTKEYEPIKFLLETQSLVQKRAQKDLQQLSLF